MQGKSRRDDGVFYMFYAEICQAVHQFQLLTITWSLDRGMFWILVLVNYEQLHIDRRCPSSGLLLSKRYSCHVHPPYTFEFYNPFVFWYVLSPITMRPMMMKGTKYLLLLAKVAPVDSSHLTLEEFRPPGKVTFMPPEYEKKTWITNRRYCWLV